MRPGTTSLLEYMLASKQLFALLQPHFLSDIVDWWLKRMPGFQEFAAKNASLLKRYIKRVYGNGLEQTVQAVMLGRSSVVNMSLLAYNAELFAWFRRFSFPNLHVLKMTHFSGSVPPWLPLVCPKLEVFTLSTDGRGDVTINSQFFIALDQCSHMNDVRLEDDFVDIKLLKTLPRATAKITSLTIGENLEYLPELCQLPTFAPREIFVRKFTSDNTHGVVRRWKALTRLSSLRRLDFLANLQTEALLSGFPPNLEKLVMKFIRPSMLTASQLESIRSKIPATLLRDIAISFAVNKGDDIDLDVTNEFHRSAVFRELLFWDEINKPDHWMTIMADGPGPVAERFREEFWNQSRRVGK